MRRAFVGLAVLAVLIASAAAGGGGGDNSNVDESDVVVVTKDNFQSVINSAETVLMEFYAPWCGHCKRLIPEYAKAATALKKNDPPVVLGKVDATAESALAGEYKVNGYPTLKIFRNGKSFDYNGPREAAGIIDYMKKQVGPAAKPLATQAELDKFTTLDAERDIVFVGFFDPSVVGTSQLHSAYTLISNQLRDEHYFGIVTNKALFKAAGVEGDEGVVAFKNYDDKRTLYAGSSKRKDVESWMTVQSLPLMGVWSEATYKRYEKRSLPIAKAMFKLDFSPENEKHTKYFTSRLEKAATQFRDRVLTTLLNMTSSDFSSVVDDMGWKGKDFGLFIQNGKAKYKFDKKFSTENVVKFYEDYLAGKVEQHIKSEAIPGSNDGPVKVLVGKNFNEIVNREDKDTLIEFYAPWCGHCKALEPKYKKLGEKMKEIESVTIAKMDATANDYPPEYNVEGFPTIYFRPAGKNSKPILYEGQREVADLQAFIKKNAAIPVSGKGRKKGSKE